MTTRHAGESDTESEEDDLPILNTTKGHQDNADLSDTGSEEEPSGSAQYTFHFS